MVNTETITSRDNGRLVNARKVRDGKRREQIFIEGRRLAAEALRSSIVIDECLISDEFRDDDLLNAINDRTTNIWIVANRLFKSIADTNEPQGIVFLARRPSIGVIDVQIETAKLPLVLFLNEINNPANLGAILRSAEAAGVAGVIISANSADVFSPRSIRAAMGSSLRLPVLENANFLEVIDWAKDRKLTTVAADISAKQSYTEMDWSRPALLIFGSEAHGLSLEQLNHVDEKILIPMENGVESLNLGVSAGIILFEAKRRVLFNGSA